MLKSMRNSRQLACSARQQKVPTFQGCSTQGTKLAERCMNYRLGLTGLAVFSDFGTWENMSCCGNGACEMVAPSIHTLYDIHLGNDKITSEWIPCEI